MSSSDSPAATRSITGMCATERHPLDEPPADPTEIDHPELPRRGGEHRVSPSSSASSAARA